MTDIIRIRLAIVALIVVVLLTTATTGFTCIYGTGEKDTPVSDAESPEIESLITYAELVDFQSIAMQFDISLQDAIGQYAWHSDFATLVAELRSMAPDSFAGAEILDSDSAWVAFADSAPKAALQMISAFSDTHHGVSTEVRTEVGFNEIELQESIEAAHFAVLERPEVKDANTGFDYATGEIRTLVVLQGTASDAVLDDLQASANEAIADATRKNFLDSISSSVVRSGYQLVWGYRNTGREHLGGGHLNGCTSGFGTEDSAGLRGVSTAGHCNNSQGDDGAPLSFQDEHQGIHGDFQWHTGPGTHGNEFYAGSGSLTEVNRREVHSVGSPIVGQVLCRNGVVTHRTCQQVRKLHFCMEDLCNLVQMRSDLTEEGDSGGPVYWGNTAYGLLAGAVVDPWPFTREVFSRADRIDDALGVHIATD